MPTSPEDHRYLLDARTSGPPSTAAVTSEFSVRPIYSSHAEFQATSLDHLLVEVGPRFEAECHTAERASCSLARILSPLVPPPVKLVRSGQYSKTDLISDVITGFTMCVFHIPQGLAYGMLAGMKPIHGLYTSLIPVLIFAIFGRSRHLSIGTFAVMSLLLRDMVEDNYKQYLPRIQNINTTLPNDYSHEEYAKLQTIIVGSFVASCLVLGIGVLRLGFFMRYISEPMLRGFTTAAGVHVLMSQVPLILGVVVPRSAGHFKILGTLINLSKVMGGTNLVTFGISACCCVTLHTVKEYVSPLVKKRMKIPLPIELIIIIATLLASKIADFHDRFGVAVVGVVPRGLPSPLLPDMRFVPAMIPAAIPLGLVGGTVTMSLAKLYCMEFQYSYNLNEDFVTLGLTNLISSFFQCFFASGSLARNTAMVSVGMKSQIAALVSCTGMLLVLLVAGPLFYSVPTCVLGSIIAVSLISLLKRVTELPTIWRASRLDFSVWVVSAGAVLVLDVTLGLAIGFVFTLFARMLTPADGVAPVVTAGPAKVQTKVQDSATMSK